MELIPIKTRILHPPKDDLIEVLDETLPPLCEGDVVTITSKIVAIAEGRCVPIEGTNKDALVRKEADFIFSPQEKTKPLTLTNHTFISAAGIDESNGEGYYIMLPENSFASAKKIHAHLMERHSIRELGVVITDSHSLPFRYGAMSVAIGCWGFQPVENHIGRADLFGREMRYSKTNFPDAIAAATTLVTGECNESQPITILRGMPNLVFTQEDPQKEFFVPYEEDIFKDLFRDFKKPI
jgi:dihydrofolate synthase / folylpolyglutamate synthase